MASSAILGGTQNEQHATYRMGIIDLLLMMGIEQLSGKLLLY